MTCRGQLVVLCSDWNLLVNKVVKSLQLTHIIFTGGTYYRRSGRPQNLAQTISCRSTNLPVPSGGPSSLPCLSTCRYLLIALPLFPCVCLHVVSCIIVSGGLVSSIIDWLCVQGGSERWWHKKLGCTRRTYHSIPHMPYPTTRVPPSGYCLHYCWRTGF